MSDKSSIEWTDATWNPTRGCTKIAQGCKNCYAETFAERFRGVKGHPYEQGFDPRTAPDKLTEPLKWKKGRRIFVDSMSDLFHEAFTFEYIAAVFGVMAACPHHTFQVLTKRPERAVEFFAWMKSEAVRLWDYIADPRRPQHAPEVVWAMEMLGRTSAETLKFQETVSPAWPLPNVWIGTSIAEQKDAGRNIPYLLQIPAAVRFLSVEPLIGPVYLSPWLWTDANGNIVRPQMFEGRGLKQPLGWVIVGGESGHGARPCNVEWIRSIVRQCNAADVSVFVKQLGAKPIDTGRGVLYCANEPHETKCNAVVLRNRKGGDWSEWPEDLRIRQFPEVTRQ